MSNTWPAYATVDSVDYRPVGRASIYSLTRPELLDLLTNAEQLLAATGDAVSAVPELPPPADRNRPHTPDAMSNS